MTLTFTREELMRLYELLRKLESSPSTRELSRPLRAEWRKISKALATETTNGKT